MSTEVVKDEADLAQFDASRVDGLDPNYHYRWGRKDPVAIMMHGVHGYEIVEASTETSILGDRTRVKQGEGTATQLEWGDLVLMRTTKENYEKRLARERSLILRRTKGVTEGYRAAIARVTGRNDIAFEEHKDNPAMHNVGDGISAAELSRSLKALPEEEDGI